MSSLERFTESELDALREVANIGAGHGATAMSQMTGQTIMIRIPKVEAVPASGMAQFLGVAADESLVISIMQVLGDITGHISLIMPTADARQLCHLLLGETDGDDGSFSQMEQSGIKEASNIVGASYLNALAEFTKLVILPSIPSFDIGVASDLFPGENDGSESTVLGAETTFNFSGLESELQGYFVLFPDEASLGVILKSVHDRIS